MRELADASRAAPDNRIKHLLNWIEREMVPALRAGGKTWTERHLLIFTEYEDTRRWVESLLREAVAHSERAEERIAVFSGSTSADRREEIKRAFNTAPADDPLRILIATDAAREGLNLQRQCRDLFHLERTAAI
jgi:superfamily II DNA/RNA helicase